MPLTKDYTYDIFISYCHSDNETLFNEVTGWIENFCDNLKPCLLKLTGKKDVAIWWDKDRLKGNTYFDESIETAVESSAILLCLNSHLYLNSDYCKQERELFYNHAKTESGIKIGEDSRILNVLLYNIPYQEWPAEFAGTPGFPFHNERGQPLEMNESEFKETFLSFCDTLVTLLKKFDIQPPQDPPIFDIFFGEVEDDLRDLRKITIDEIKKETITITDKKTNAELKKQKFEIIAGVPPPFEKEKHEEVVNKDLEKVELSVHLLDNVAGRNISEEEPLCYPQRQAELSLLTTKPKLIWVPADMNIETVKEKNYKNFLLDLENNSLPATGYTYVRSLESEVAQQVIDMANKVYDDWQINPGPGQLLIDTHYNDQLFALDVYQKLLNNHIQPIFNPQEGDPKKNDNILNERIRQVSKLIFVYGKISSDWITERIKIAAKLVIEKKYPINKFIVLRLPPHKELNLVNFGQSAIKIDVIDNNSPLQLDQEALEQILKNIKAIA
jgi:hypothetical protein